MNPRHFLHIITSLLLALTASGAETTTLAPKPNIIWIMADDLGYGDLGCYGAKDIPTPHIDSLAAGGVRCETFYAAASTCSPSRASILSGLYPEALGIGGALMGEGGLPAEAVTIAETLKASGYTTGLIGKWHLGYEGETLPNRQGFDEFYGHRGGKIDYFTHHDTAQKIKGSKDGKHDFYENEKEIFPEGYSTDLFTERAVSFVDRHKAEPFFNPLFPALRSSPTAFSGASRKKQIPSSKKLLGKAVWKAMFATNEFCRETSESRQD